MLCAISQVKKEKVTSRAGRDHAYYLWLKLVCRLLPPKLIEVYLQLIQGWENDSKYKTKIFHLDKRKQSKLLLWSNFRSQYACTFSNSVLKWNVKTTQSILEAKFITWGLNFNSIAIWLLQLTMLYKTRKNKVPDVITGVKLLNGLNF